MQIVDVIQRTPEWWLARKGIPTASAFDKIVTPAKFDPSKQMEGYACQLVAEKFDKFYSISPEFQSVAMEEGTLLEPEARRYYEYHRRCDVVEVGFTLTDDGRFGSSPDAMVGTPSEWLGEVEMKCPQPHTHVKYLLNGKLPTEYGPQVHGHLIVSGLPWVDFMSYAPGFPPLLVRVEPDEKTEKLRKALDEFWDLYQTISARVEARHREYIDSEIDRRQDTIPKEMQSFVA